MNRESILQVIRQAKNDIYFILNDKANETGEVMIPGKYFKGYEYDAELVFGSYSEAMRFIVDTLVKEMN